eukprot:jgi/Tetstr1/463811/TSEL_008625.t1
MLAEATPTGGAGGVEFNASRSTGFGAGDDSPEQSRQSADAASLSMQGDNGPGMLSAEPLISRGRDASGRYPYYVSLRYKSGDFHFCGGALIAPDTVMTAAHCIQNSRDTRGIEAHVGRECYDNDGLNGCREGDFGGFVRVGVQQVIIHPEWKGDDDVIDGGDLALLKLTRSLQGAPLLRVIPQPSSLGRLTVIGLGGVDTTAKGEPVDPDQLQESSHTFVSQEECQRLYGGKCTDQKSCICAQASFSDTCNGDSGGPLLIKGGSWQQDVAIGVVSFGATTNCGQQPTLPSAFSSLRYYEPWLRSRLQAAGVVLPATAPSQRPPAPSSSETCFWAAWLHQCNKASTIVRRTSLRSFQAAMTEFGKRGRHLVAGDYGDGYWMGVFEEGPEGYKWSTGSFQYVVAQVRRGAEDGYSVTSAFTAGGTYVVWLRNRQPEGRWRFDSGHSSFRDFWKGETLQSGRKVVAGFGRDQSNPSFFGASAGTSLQTVTTADVWQLSDVHATLRYYLDRGYQMSAMMSGIDNRGYHSWFFSGEKQSGASRYMTRSKAEDIYASIVDYWSGKCVRALTYGCIGYAAQVGARSAQADVQSAAWSDAQPGQAMDTVNDPGNSKPKVLKISVPVKQQEGQAAPFSSANMITVAAAAGGAAVVAIALVAAALVYVRRHRPGVSSDIGIDIKVKDEPDTDAARSVVMRSPDEPDDLLRAKAHPGEDIEARTTFIAVHDAQLPGDTPVGV